MSLKSFRAGVLQGHDTTGLEHYGPGVLHAQRTIGPKPFRIVVPWDQNQSSLVLQNHPHRCAVDRTITRPATLGAVLSNPLELPG